MKAAIIGCGNIGTALALVLEKQSKIKLCSLSDENTTAVNWLQKKLKVHHPKKVDLEEAIDTSDLIIEAASPAAVKAIIKYISQHGLRKKLIVVSTGGLISTTNLLKKIPGCEIHIPSGAIAGLDAIKAVSGKIDSLELVTTKPPSGLKGNLFLQKQNPDLAALKRKQVVFTGNIFDAVRNFPQNINVAASLFLASGYKKIKVSIIADPLAKTNIHEIICTGKFGTIHTITNNLPSPNPKTSFLALLSAQSLLRNISNQVKIGC